MPDTAAHRRRPGFKRVRHSPNHRVAMPEEGEEADDVGDRRDEGARGDGRVDVEAVEHERNDDAAERRRRRGVITMARPITGRARPMPNQKTATPAMSSAKATPLRKPTSISRRITRQALARPRSRVAARAPRPSWSACRHCRPCEATIGISTASATIFCERALEQADHRRRREARCRG